MSQSRIQGIFARVARHLGTVTIGISKAGTRTRAPGGDWVTLYGEFVLRRAIVEPMSQARVLQLGLDLTKLHVEIFTNFAITTVQRGGTPDRIRWGGETWEAETTEDWQEINGWSATVCTKLSQGQA